MPGPICCRTCTSPYAPRVSGDRTIFGTGDQEHAPGRPREAAPAGALPPGSAESGFLLVRLRPVTPRTCPPLVVLILPPVRTTRCRLAGREQATVDQCRLPVWTTTTPILARHSSRRSQVTPLPRQGRHCAQPASNRSASFLPGCCRYGAHQRRSAAVTGGHCSATAPEEAKLPCRPPGRHCAQPAQPASNRSGGFLPGCQW